MQKKKKGNDEHKIWVIGKGRDERGRTHWELQWFSFFLAFTLLSCTHVFILSVFFLTYKT